MRYKAHRPHYTLGTGEAARTSTENLWRLNEVMKCFPPPHRRGTQTVASGRSLSVQTEPPALVSVYVRNVCAVQKELKLRTHRSRSTLRTKTRFVCHFCARFFPPLLRRLSRDLAQRSRARPLALQRVFISNSADERTLLCSALAAPSASAGPSHDGVPCPAPPVMASLRPHGLPRATQFGLIRLLSYSAPESHFYAVSSILRTFA